MKKLRGGFTLIELLIVIALLGALAVGLLATIDPFEQLKKGRDTSLRNTTSEFYNANLRYYATKGQFPWATIAGTTSTSFTATKLNTMGNMVTELVTVGELKERFMELAGTSNLVKILVTSTDPEQIAVCYMPESKAFQEDNATIYTTDGQTSTTVCKSQTSGTAGTDCYFCVQ